MPVHDPGPSCGEASSASLFTEVLHHVPHILDLVPPGDALSVACTCWAALLPLLQYGRRIEEGECEWTWHVSYDYYYYGTCFFYELDLKSEQRTVPMLQLGNITLLGGLALRVSAGSQYVGELQYAGARVPVQDAAALLAAVVAAGVDSTSLSGHGVGELAAVLEAAGRPRAARLRVTRLAVQRNLLSSYTVAPDVREERVSALCRVLSTPAVREHTRHIDIAHIKMGETMAAEILGALSTGQALETLNVRGNTLSLTGARALAKVVRMSTKLRALDLDGVGHSPRGATTVAEAVVRSGHIRKLVVSQHIDGVVDELARHGCGGLETLYIKSSLSAESAGKLAACATNLSSLNVAFQYPITTATTGVIKQLVQPGSLLRDLTLRLPDGGRDVVVKELCAAVVSNPSSRLETLVLRGHLTKHSAEAIATLLASGTTLRALTLTGSVLTDAGYVHIAEALAQNITLRELTIDGAVMRDADTFAKLAPAVASSRLEVFEMPRTTFPTDTTINIADLSRSSTLRRIHIYLEAEETWGWHGVEYGKGSQLLAGVRDFAAGLAHNNVLRILALDEFTGFAEADGFGALAEALRTNTALRSLSIKQLCLSQGAVATQDGMHTLAGALRHNRGLRSVELGYGSDAGSEAKQMMVQALRENTTLQRLCVGRLLHAETRVYGLSFGDSIKNVGGPLPRIVLQDTPAPAAHAPAPE